MESRPGSPDYLRFKEAAEQFGMSPSTWARLARGGAIPSYKLGQRVVLLARADIERFLAEHRQEVHA